MHGGIIPTHHCSNAWQAGPPLLKGEALPIESRVLVSPCRFFAFPQPHNPRLKTSPVASLTNHILQNSIKRGRVRDALDAQLPHSGVPTLHLPNLPSFSWSDRLFHRISDSLAQPFHPSSRLFRHWKWSFIQTKAVHTIIKLNTP